MFVTDSQFPCDDRGILLGVGCHAQGFVEQRRLDSSVHYAGRTAKVLIDGVEDLDSVLGFVEAQS